jgi:hypothetical protein
MFRRINFLNVGLSTIALSLLFSTTTSHAFSSVPSQEPGTAVAGQTPSTLPDEVLSTPPNAAAGTQPSIGLAATSQFSVLSPLDGATVPEGDLTVNGRLGNASGKETTVVYVVDVSGSTSSGSFDCNGDGAVTVLDDFNGDGGRGNVLDCEIASLIALNTSLSARTDVKVAIIPFGTTADIADVAPATGEQQFVKTTDPSSSGGNDRTTYVGQVLTSLGFGTVNQFTPKSVGQSTNFDAALTKAVTLANATPDSPVVLFFLSDGIATLGTGSTSGYATLKATGRVTVNTFAVGAGTGGSPCTRGNPLGVLADGLGGTCTNVADPGKLVAALPSSSGSANITVSLTNTASAKISQLSTTATGLNEFRVTFPKVATGNYDIVVTVSRATATEQTTLNVTVVTSSLTYAALGDSYSSGEGRDPWLDSSKPAGLSKNRLEAPYDKRCHRSREAYAFDIEIAGKKLATDPATSASFRFAACAGAIWRNVTSVDQDTGSRGGISPYQLQYLTPQTTLVTISIGGNDLSFSSLLGFCAKADHCQNGSYANLGGKQVTLKEWADLRLAVFSSELPAVLSAVRSRIAPNARIVVVGYPTLLGLGDGCTVEDQLFELDERQFVVDAANKLDALEIATVQRLGGLAAGFSFVSATKHFERHVPCATNSHSEAWIAGVDFKWGGFTKDPSKWLDDQSFHPTGAGQGEYGKLINKDLVDHPLANAITSPTQGTATATQQVTTPSFPFDTWITDILGSEINADAAFATYAANSTTGSLHLISSRRSNGIEDSCSVRVVPTQVVALDAHGFAPGSSVKVSIGASTFETTADSTGLLTTSIRLADDLRDSLVASAVGTNIDGGQRFVSGLFGVDGVNSECGLLAAAAHELPQNPAVSTSAVTTTAVTTTAVTTTTKPPLVAVSPVTELATPPTTTLPATTVPATVQSTTVELKSAAIPDSATTVALPVTTVPTTAAAVKVLGAQIESAEGAEVAFTGPIELAETIKLSAFLIVVGLLFLNGDRRGRQRRRQSDESTL